MLQHSLSINISIRAAAATTSIITNNNIQLIYVCTVDIKSIPMLISRCNNTQTHLHKYSNYEIISWYLHRRLQ
jgi:hypothetical protein